jgi:hypothetical protein
VMLPAHGPVDLMVDRRVPVLRTATGVAIALL